MPDPYAPVQPGDPVEFHALAWNAMLRAAQRVSRTEINTIAPVPSTTASATIIQVLNATGDVLPRNSVLGLGDPIFTPHDTSVDVFLRAVTFRGVKPNIDLHFRKYVITLDPAQVNQVVRAYIAGVCQVLVDQQDHTHEYAIIVDDTTSKMKSSRHGHSRILWREGLEGDVAYAYDAGLQWAIVMMGVTGSSGEIGKAGAISAISGTTLGTGRVDIYVRNGSHVDGPVENFEVFNVGDAISAGKWVAIEWDADDTAWVAPLDCEPYA